MDRTIRKRMGIFTGKGADNAQDFELERLYCPGLHSGIFLEDMFV